MTQYKNECVGKIIKIEWNQHTNEMKVIIEIVDDKFKSHVLHNKIFEDVLTFDGKDVMIISSRKK